MSDTVKLGYGAASNISFHGKIDTGITREEWDEMDGEEQEHVVVEELYSLVEIWVEGDV